MKIAKSKMIKIIITIICIVVVAVLGSVFVRIGMDWFNSLIKPEQWIPNFIIPIVWTVIYIVTGVILCRWWSQCSVPLNVNILFIINGILNVVWCLFFFTLKLTFVGNLVIVLNLFAGIALYYAIIKIKPIYAYFFHYLSCVAFYGNDIKFGVVDT